MNKTIVSKGGILSKDWFVKYNASIILIHAD